MTDAQVRWAQSHSWYISDYNGAVTVMDYATNEDGLTVQEPRTFTDYEALAIWAGY